MADDFADLEPEIEALADLYESCGDETPTLGLVAQTVLRARVGTEPALFSDEAITPHFVLSRAWRRWISRFRGTSSWPSWPSICKHTWPVSSEATMADYRVTKVRNGWLVCTAHMREQPGDFPRPVKSWIARTAAEAGVIIGLQEGEGPAPTQWQEVSLGGGKGL